MPLFSQKEILNFKLKTIPKPFLKELALSLRVNSKGKVSEIIKRIIDKSPNMKTIDKFIKQKYPEKAQEWKETISDESLKKELNKVKTFAWGAVQGQLDRKIQTEYVRKIVRYKDLLSNVKAKLHDDITNYVVCSWFNHWTTVLIEDHISTHPRVIPTIKNIKGVDIFFDDQPFDLKVTYVPHNYDPIEAAENPSKLAVWMYENQSSLRFGADNRLFVILLNKDNPKRSWELKRNFPLVFSEIDTYFDKETVSEEDEIVFAFGRKTYTTITKVLMITKP